MKMAHICSKFGFKELLEQAKFIDEGVEWLSKKIINCDIGEGDPKTTLTLLDKNLCEAQEKLDFLCDSLTKDVNSINKRNAEIRRFLTQLTSKIERLETCEEDYKSLPSGFETPLSAHVFHSRYKK